MAKDSGKDNFLNLIESNKKIIFKICNSYCRNSSEREDLAQEIIYNLWKSGEAFNADYKFSTWMYRVALNVAISFYRKENKRQTSPLTEHILNIEEQETSYKASEENINLLQKFINELKELDRALMILYLEEKTYSEIADILGISETNVATRISRCKEKLKQKFSQHNN